MWRGNDYGGSSKSGIGIMWEEKNRKGSKWRNEENRRERLKGRKIFY